MEQDQDDRSGRMIVWVALAVLIVVVLWAVFLPSKAAGQSTDRHPRLAVSGLPGWACSPYAGIARWAVAQPGGALCENSAAAFVYSNLSGGADIIVAVPINQDTCLRPQNGLTATVGVLPGFGTGAQTVYGEGWVLHLQPGDLASQDCLSGSSGSKTGMRARVYDLDGRHVVIKVEE